MLAKPALAEDPASVALAEDDRVCPGCLRRLDLPATSWQWRRADHPWWLIALTLVALCVSVAFVARAENTQQVVLQNRAQLLELRPYGTEGAVDRKPMLRAANLEAEAMSDREATLALAVAVVGMLGILGGASAIVRRLTLIRERAFGCPMCAPRQSRQPSPVARFWHPVEYHLILLDHVFVAGFFWVAIQDLLAGSSMGWRVVALALTQTLDALGSIIPLSILL
jgi:hypothetical protein